MFSFLARMRNRREALGRLDRAVGITSFAQEVKSERPTQAVLVFLAFVMGADIYLLFLG